MRVNVLLASRGGGRYLAVLAGAGLAGVAGSAAGLKVDMAANHPALVIGLPELFAVLLVCAGVIMLRPRLWIVDRLGTPWRRWIPATSAAVAVIGGPQLVLAAAAEAGPARGTWPLSATTVLLLGSLAVVAAPFIGALRSGGLVVLLYFATLLTAQLAPAGQAWSPLPVVAWHTAQPFPAGRAALACGFTVVALTVTVLTLGRTMTTWGRDLDTA